MRTLSAACIAIAILIAVPSTASAQASITGLVKDSSGGVLPGVTVEASSPDLIERARAAVTDGSGQYRIVDLRGGTYTVTFTLPGFSVVKREGIVLEGSFTATVNADLRVGTLEETITVTGESPIVDVLGRAATMRGSRVSGPGGQRRGVPALRSRRDHRGVCRADTDGERNLRSGNGGIPRLRATRTASEVDLAADEPVPARGRRGPVQKPLGREVDARGEH